MFAPIRPKPIIPICTCVLLSSWPGPLPGVVLSFSQLRERLLANDQLAALARDDEREGGLVAAIDVEADGVLAERRGELGPQRPVRLQRDREGVVDDRSRGVEPGGEAPILVAEVREDQARGRLLG